jgi:hypothetical protein
LVIRGRKLPKDGWIAIAQQAAKDSPSPGGEGRGEGGRDDKLTGLRREQLELIEAAQKFGGEQRHKLATSLSP